jgi:hypothetical protein
MESIMVHFRFPQASTMQQRKKEEEEDDDDKSLTATFSLSFPPVCRLLQKGGGGEMGSEKFGNHTNDY